MPDREHLAVWPRPFFAQRDARSFSYLQPAAAEIGLCANCYCLMMGHRRAPQQLALPPTSHQRPQPNSWCFTSLRPVPSDPLNLGHWSPPAMSTSPNTGGPQEFLDRLRAVGHATDGIDIR